MQEIGPRFTLKLRWIKKDSLATGRRRVNGQVVHRGGVHEEEGMEDESKTLETDEPRTEEAGAEDVAPDEGVDEAMRAAVDAVDRSSTEQAKDAKETSQSDGGVHRMDVDDTTTRDGSGTGEGVPSDPTTTKAKKKKRRHARTTSPTGTRIIIPTIQPGPPKEGIRKGKRPRSILDSFSLRGGVDDSAKEFAWKVSWAIWVPFSVSPGTRTDLFYTFYSRR
jgi:ribosome production factor 1